MNAPADLKQATSRNASGRASALRTGFGGLGGESGFEPRAAALAKPPGFDVCHVGVVLRAVVFIEVLLALGAAFFVADAADWALQFAAGTAFALPALLLWLALLCAIQKPLIGLGAAWQWAFVGTAGAACALASWLLWSALQWGEARPAASLHALRIAAVAGSGAVTAAAFFLWLRQRARLALPAATTARLAELQSRIRPHFLFNTLNSAIALVRTDPRRAEAVLEDLAELFRVALAEHGPQATVSLHDEVELARRYLAIEQVRFGDRLRLQWELDPAADTARLPALLLQPLVENAVRHGVEPAPAGGTVRVRTRLRRGRAEILVANTVAGSGSVPGHGIGLRNVRERLRLLHDVAGDFRAGLDGDVYRVLIAVPM
ncbi:MAG TPA: histidine kinase [Methylibium sp.]|uniref:sensor histidine kinase n=1 Tax=Methylibium sp. TaxID=2067992 RepID=UPI002DB75C36|nr:histidine kinase [Methylibium sp.]HEU4458163.1 histidine kinase [Methylibium sp.]